MIDNPYAGRYKAKLDALIEAGEELDGAARQALRRSARYRTRRSAELRQGRDCRRGGRTRTRGRDLASRSSAPLPRPSKRARRSCRRRKNGHARHRQSTCRSATKTPLSCAVISTPSRRACRTRRVPMKSSSRCRDGVGPAAAAHRRLAGERDQGRGWFALRCACDLFRASPQGISFR